MIGQDNEVVRVNQGPLRGAAEKIVGVGDDILVQGGAARHEQGQRGAATPPCAAGLLPGAGNGPGIAVNDAGLQLADIKAQLQGIGADHRLYLAFTQAHLDGAPLPGQVAAAVAADTAIPAGDIFLALLEVGQQQLHPEAAAGKDNRLHLLPVELFGQAACL